MSRQIEFTNLYLKDLYLARKRNLPEDELNRIIEQLANDVPLAAKQMGRHVITICDDIKVKTS